MKESTVGWADGVGWQIDVRAAIDKWLKTTYRRRYCTLCRLRNHSARFYVTNYDKPLHLFDFSCTVLCGLLAPCWLLTAPFYKVVSSALFLFSVVFCMSSVRRPTYHTPPHTQLWIVALCFYTFLLCCDTFSWAQSVLAALYNVDL